MKILLNIVLEQNINIFDLSSSFYTDICFHFKSPNGKDIPLKERILSFFPNISLCDDDCVIKGVNITTMKAICECKIKEIMDNYLLSNELIMSNEIISNAISLVKENNLVVLKCYKDIIKYEYFSVNIGGFIMMFFIIIHLISAFIYFYTDSKKVKIYLFNVVELYPRFLKNSKKRYDPPKRRLQKRNKTNFDNKLKEINSPFSYINASSINIKNRTKSSKSVSSKQKFQFKKSWENKISNEKFKSNIDFNEFLLSPLDENNYIESIQKDKRKICELFIDSIKESRMILNTFIIKDDIKPKSIKIITSLLTIILYFVINGLFYNENYITELYLSNDKKNFFDFLNGSITRLLSVPIIVSIIDYFIDLCFTDEDYIKEILIENKSNMLEFKRKMNQLIIDVNKKYIILIIISTIFNLFSWFYVSCFNNVYPNTKFDWIKSSLFLYIVVQLFCFLKIFLQSIFRYVSLKFKSQKIFQISQVFD